MLFLEDQKRQKGLKSPNSISPETLVTEGCLTPQNDRKHHIYISVWYNIYPSDHRKYPFGAKKGQNRAKSLNSISPEPLVSEGWLTSQNDRKTQVCISVWYNLYPSDHRKYYFLEKRPIRQKATNELSIRQIATIVFLSELSREHMF